VMRLAVSAANNQLISRMGALCSTCHHGIHKTDG
jgi:hypothetical protein